MVVEGNAIGQSMIDIQGFYRRLDNVFVLTEVDNIKFMNMFLKNYSKTTKKIST